MRIIKVGLSVASNDKHNKMYLGYPRVPAECAPVDDPPELRLAPAAAPGGVSGPVAAPAPGPAHLDHAPPPESGQLRPESAENRKMLIL